MTRINSYIIDVGNEEEGENLLSKIEDEINGAIHPDDVVMAITDAGYEVEEVCYGAEDVEYELQ